MKLKFTSQAYQDEAVKAVTDLFQGGDKLAYRHIKRTHTIIDSVGNTLPAPVELIQNNLHKVQRHNLLPLTHEAQSLSFCIDMETGTGKTYVYTKTIYELHQQYGLSKFIIVVPSVAIREGVQKSLEMTHEHFQTLYNRQPIHWFVYNSSRLNDVRDFAESTSIEVMIINIDAFRKSENIIHQPLDRMNSVEKPIELIQNVRPVVIIDEPQSVDNTPKAKEAISWLNPLFTLRYSATHREKINTIYSLTPVDAYQQGLVKNISVSSIASQDGFNHPYLRLVSVDNANGYKARLEMDVKTATGSLARATKTVKTGDDLYLVCGERELYQGWRITDIDCQPGFEKIELSGGHQLMLGQSMGNVADVEIKRGQIRKTIEIHLDKELRLLSEGVKVLSLFFIDRVDKYRLYENDKPAKGLYAAIFEEEYQRLIGLPKYAPIVAAMPWAKDADQAHEGYFSIDKKGKVKDTRGDTVDDQSTYALIMRDKEKLISFATPLRFIFSHSALKEGWDNPNVFQVCTLLEQSSALSARQKIGRGLRLCVNQDGERLYDRQINSLHVIASEHFAEFADNLQKEIEKETGIKFGALDISNFIDIEVPLEVALTLGIPIPHEHLTPSSEQPEPSKPEQASTPVILPVSESNEPNWTEPDLPVFTPTPQSAPTVRLGHEGAQKLVAALTEQGVIDKKGQITSQGRKQIEDDSLTLPPAYQPIANPIIAQIRKANTKITVRDDSKKIIVRQNKQVLVSPEFKAIWERIRQKTLYRVKMDTHLFIEFAAKRLQQMPPIKPARLVETTATVDVQKSGVTTRETHSRALELEQKTTPIPQLLAILCEDLELLYPTMLQIIKSSGRIADFCLNPEKFIEQASAILRDSKAEMVMDGIRYERIAGAEYSIQEIFDKQELIAYLEYNAIPANENKSVYDHVVVDVSGVERRFAQALNDDPDVKLFFKLPDKFKIDTPLGTYNPDWAVLLDKDGAERLYFVLETKGTSRQLDLRGQESIKIECGKRHFEALDCVTYEVATDWKSVKLSV